MRKKKLAILLGVLIVLCGCFLLRCRHKRGQSEQYAVYSAYIASRLTGESHSFGGREGLFVILEVSKFADHRFPLAGVSRARRLSSVRTSTLFSFALANVRDEEFNSKFVLPARYVLASSAEVQEYGTRDFLIRFPRNYGYITLSRIGFSADFKQAVFYTEHICGLCGNGEFVLMQEVNGHWIIQEESYTWIS